MLRKKLKKIKPLKILVISLRSLFNKPNILKRFYFLIDFLKDYKKFKKITENKNFELKTEDLYPRIYDKTKSTPIDPVYFYQNSWCARKIFENQPKEHFDVGSDLKMLGIISQFVPTIMIDIRPPEIYLENFEFKIGSILNLPFPDDSIDSLSSICVIEHIGLGRYRDKLDSFGSEKAIKELKRVLKKEGNLYISVPIDDKNKIYFNAHRAFTKDYILELFSPLSLIEEKYIYGNKIYNEYDGAKGFGTGLYHFKKI